MASRNNNEFDTDFLSILHKDLDPDQKDEEQEINKSSHSGDSSVTPAPVEKRHYLNSIDATIVTRQLPSEGLSFQLWPAAFSFVSLLDRNPSPLFLPSSSPLRILELGSGTGLVGIAAAAILGAHVTLTDLPHVLPNLRFNAIANTDIAAARSGNLAARQLRWGSVEDYAAIGTDPAFDVIIASDVVYYDHLIKPLVETLRFFVKGEVAFLMAHLRRWKKRDAVFFRIAKKLFEVATVHTDQPIPGSRTGVSIYRFTSRSRSPKEPNLPKSLKDSWRIVQESSSEPLRVMILQYVIRFSSRSNRYGIAQSPAGEVDQPNYFLLTLRQVQNCILYQINKMS